MGQFNAYGIQCICGAKERASTLGRHKYDRRPVEALPEGWARWLQYLLCPVCWENRTLLNDMHGAVGTLRLRGQRGWINEQVGNGLNLTKDGTVLIRAEPRTGTLYVLGQPFEGSVEEALDSDQIKVWLAENG